MHPDRRRLPRPVARHTANQPYVSIQVTTAGVPSNASQENSWLGIISYGCWLSCVQRTRLPSLIWQDLQVLVLHARHGQVPAIAQELYNFRMIDSLPEINWCAHNIVDLINIL